MASKISLEEFIKRSKTIHGNKYDYSLTNYINNKTKVKVICPNHGIFEQQANHHLEGMGCRECGYIIMQEKQSLQLDDFINKAKQVHNNKYDYSFVDYKNNLTKIKIMCPKHGEFYQTPGNHLSGQGCPQCKGGTKSTLKEFVAKANKIHSNKYDYSESKYINANSKLKIICPDHGPFYQRPGLHINQKQGCPKCIDYYRSKGEKEIYNILSESNFNFKTQHSFNGCRNTNLLRFDFYLPDYNICIEYDGEQHTKPLKFFGGRDEFIKRKENDHIKEEYCRCSNIKLLRINYNEDVELKMKSIIDYIRGTHD
jgi:very-short-patch-repair endonuclease